MASADRSAADSGAPVPFERAFGYRRRLSASGDANTPPTSAVDRQLRGVVDPLPPLRLGVLLSGSGRTLQNLVENLRATPGVAEVVCVISDRASAYGLERARLLGIPDFVLPCRNPGDSLTLFQKLEEHRVELLLLGGFLRLLTLPPTWEQRVLNIHPSLIPKYCGAGFYGDRVHRAVLDGGETESGCTVHFVDNIYDNGPPLLQERVAVLPGDTVESLAQRVFDAECRAFPRAVRSIAEGHVHWGTDGPIIAEPR